MSLPPHAPPALTKLLKGLVRDARGARQASDARAVRHLQVLQRLAHLAGREPGVLALEPNVGHVRQLGLGGALGLGGHTRRGRRAEQAAAVAALGRGARRASAGAAGAQLAQGLLPEAVLLEEEERSSVVSPVLRRRPRILVLGVGACLHELAVRVGVDPEHLLKLPDLDVGRREELVDLGTQARGRDGERLAREVVPRVLHVHYQLRCAPCSRVEGWRGVEGKLGQGVIPRLEGLNHPRDALLG